MANHPARPAHPFIDPRELRDELTDLDNLTADLFGPDVPLRDRVATLVADWQDSSQRLPQQHGGYALGWAGRQDAADRQSARRGLA